MMAQLAHYLKRRELNPLSNWAVGLPEDATAVHSSAGRVDRRPVMWRGQPWISSWRGVVTTQWFRLGRPVPVVR